jgi:sugar lactone lactonase YvrE
MIDLSLGERVRMPRHPRARAHTARRGVLAGSLFLALLLVLAARAGSDDGPKAAAGGLGTDIAGLAFDAEGRLFAADVRNDRVVRVDPAGAVVAEVGAGRFARPTGVAIAPGGDVLVADDHGVTRLAPDGSLVAAWDADGPTGIAAGADGTLYVSEQHAIARFAGDGAPLARWGADAPRGIAVAADGTVWAAVADGLAHFAAEGAPLGTTPADHAEGVAVAPDGTVLVAERTLDRVARVAPDGTRAGAIEDGFDAPRGVAVDCRGNVAVADDSRARIHRLPAPGQAPPCVTDTVAAAPPAVEPVRPLARRPVATPAPAAEVLPLLGRTALATPVSGRVLVRLPGTRTPAILGAPREVPMGTTFDTRDGRVRLTFATRTVDFGRLGTTQTGDFDSGLFTIAQGRGASLVELRLAGPRPVCRVAATGRPLGPRRLWADVHGGSFRTRGVVASATAADARWLTQDRCDGTLVQVARGSVSVRNRVRGGTVRVRAGQRHLARARTRLR